MIKKSIILSLIASLILVSCKEKEQLNGEQSKKPLPVLGKYYFDFDEVVYYTVPDDSPDKYTDNDHNTKMDSIAMDIFFGEAPGVNDTESIAYLDSIGFRKKYIPASKHNSMREIFRERSFIPPSVDTACAPIYRDIYIIKDKGKNVGIVKICYECSQHYITGTKADTEGFGLNGEYSELLKVD